MKNDLLMQLAMAEAMDESGIYDNPRLEQQLQDYAYRLRCEEQFNTLDEINYEDFLRALLDHF